MHALGEPAAIFMLVKRDYCHIRQSKILQTFFIVIQKIVQAHILAMAEKGVSYKKMNGNTFAHMTDNI